MADSETEDRRIEGADKKTNPSSDPPGEIDNNSTKLMFILTCSGADPKMLRSAISAFEKERCLAKKCGRESDSPFRSLASNISESFGATINWLLEKENNRKIVRAAKKGGSRLLTEDLCNISEVGEAGMEEHVLKDSLKKDATEMISSEIEDELFAVSEAGYRDDIQASIGKDSNGTSIGKKVRRVVKKEEKWDESVDKEDELDEGSESSHCALPEVESDGALRRNEQSSKKNGKKKRVHKYRERPDQEEIVECDVCGKKMRNDSLRKHKKALHSEDVNERRPHQCEDCGHRFSLSSHLKVHQRIHSNDEKKRKPYQCDQCDKRFSRPDHVRSHKKTHLTKDDVHEEFPCDECGKIFKWIQALRVHKKLHLSDDDPQKGKAPCEICGKVLANTHNLKLHMETHLDDNDPEQAEKKKSHKCETCGRGFRNKHNLEQHIEMVHNYTAEKYAIPENEVGSNREVSGNKEETTVKHPLPGKWKCDECGQCFKWKGSLYNHKRDHLPIEEARPFPCDECGKRFHYVYHLEAHKLSHLAPDDPLKKVFECEICNKVLGGPYRLQKHMETHLDDNDPEEAERKKPHKCDECGDRFRNAANLRNHKTNVHNHDPNASYDCQVCGKHYTKEPSLRKHMMEKHSDAEKLRKKERKCDVCGKICMGDTELKNHKMMHLDDNDPVQAALKQRHKCEICEKTFRNNTNLRNHMNIYTGNFPFKCDSCTIGFNSKGALAKHKIAHENGTWKATRTNTQRCVHCSKRFLDDAQLAKHVRQYHEGKIKCDHCELLFEKMWDLRIHQTKMHNESSKTRRRMRNKQEGTSEDFIDDLSEEEEERSETSEEDEEDDDEESSESEEDDEEALTI